MTSRAYAVDRVVLALLGLLLVAAGGLGLALSLGAFGAWRATYPVLPQRVSTFAVAHTWFWWTVLGVLLVVAALALLWLLAQLRSDRASRLDLTTDARDGYTTLRASALTRAVEDQAMGFPGVTGASASLRDRRGRRVFLRVELADSADIGRVRSQVEDDLVPHLRDGIGDPYLRLTCELRPGVSRRRAL